MGWKPKTIPKRLYEVTEAMKLGIMVPFEEDLRAYYRPRKGSLEYGRYASPEPDRYAVFLSLSGSLKRSAAEDPIPPL